MQTYLNPTTYLVPTYTQYKLLYFLSFFSLQILTLLK